MSGIPLHKVATIRVGVEAVITYNNEYLFQRRSRNLEFFPEYLSFLGGHIDQGESAMDALIKEVKEESGITINPKDCKFIFNRIVHNHDSNIIWSIQGFIVELPEKIIPQSSIEGECIWLGYEDVLKEEKVVPSNLYDLKKVYANPNLVTYEYGEIINNTYIVKT